MPRIYHDRRGDPSQERVDRSDHCPSFQHRRLRRRNDAPIDNDRHRRHHEDCALHGIVRVFRAAAVRFSEDGCAFLAQAIAFNALLAVFPLLLLAIAVLAFIYGTDEGQATAIALFATVAPGIKTTLTENLHQVINLRGISGVIGLLTLIWSGKNLFMALAFALDRALGIRVGRPLLSGIMVSLVMLPVVGLLMIAATAVPIIITIAVQYGGFPHAPLFSVFAGYASAFLLIFTLSALLYTY
ncbi:MAG: YihY/virulence factor BrkB family protein, partial [Candidatus Eremiobacteraeota bacterium]|nr:YihY/virulence factor BrkB family protein [Candidatus Eremiobacteraeota bacterium]